MIEIGLRTKQKKKETKILTDFIWLTTVCARPRIFFVFSPFRLTPLIPYDSRTDEELRRPTCSFYTGQPKQKQNKKKRKEMCVLKWKQAGIHSLIYSYK